MNPEHMTREQKFESALRLVFSGHPGASVKVYSRRERFLLEAVSYAIQQGWLTTELVKVDDQSSHLEGHLTEAGKQHFGITEASNATKS